MSMLSDRPRVYQWKLFRPATFNGIHNLRKAQCWLCLLVWYNSFHQGMSAWMISAATGLNRDSLYVLFNRWLRWGYVEYSFINKTRVYTLTRHGRGWLERHWDVMAAFVPHVQQQLNEYYKRVPR